MIEAVRNQKSVLYAECAADAFLTAQSIAINESGGVEPESNEVWTEILEYGKTVVVAVYYTLCPFGGCSSEYHVIEPDKVRKVIYKFKDGLMTGNGGPIFEDAWLTSSKNMQTRFFYDYTDIINPPKCIA